MNAMLELEKVRCGYGPATVLSDVSLTVHTGEIVAVLGRNGAGKTTLINTIMGLVPAQGGSIRVAGAELVGEPTWRIARRGVAIVPQGRRVFTSLTVGEHLAVAHRRPPRPGRDTPGPGPVPGPGPAPSRPPDARPPTAGALDPPPARPWTPETVLDLLPGLRLRLRHRGNQLSGGEQQMLALARALLANPRLLLLDEPTEGLAPVIALQVADTIRHLADTGTAILIAEQNIGVVRAVADRSVALYGGTLAGGLNHDQLDDADIMSRLLGVQ